MQCGSLHFSEMYVFNLQLIFSSEVSGGFELQHGGLRKIFIGSRCFVSALQHVYVCVFVSVCVCWRCMMLLASSVHVWPQLRMWFQLLLHVYRVAVHCLVATCRDGIGSSTLSLGLTIKPVGDRRSIASLYLQCSPCFMSMLAFKLLFCPFFSFILVYSWHLSTVLS